MERVLCFHPVQEFMSADFIPQYNLTEAALLSGSLFRDYVVNIEKPVSSQRCQ